MHVTRILASYIIWCTVYIYSILTYRIIDDKSYLSTIFFLNNHVIRIKRKYTLNNDLHALNIFKNHSSQHQLKIIFEVKNTTTDITKYNCIWEISRIQHIPFPTKLKKYKLTIFPT